MDVTTIIGITFAAGFLVGGGAGYLLKSALTEKPQWKIEEEARQLELSKRGFDGPDDRSIKIY